MKSLAGAILLALFILLPGLPAQAADDAIVFGTNAWQSPKAMHEFYQPLVDHLGKELGKRAKLIVVKEYDDLAKKIRTQQIDIGFFSANAYDEAKEHIPGLKYLASSITVHDDPQMKKRDYYRSVIIVAKDSPFYTLEDLKGKRFAFTNQTSSSGYIFPKMMLQERGIDPATYFSEVFWLEKHTRITSALVAGSIDAGATFDNLVQRESTKYGDAFRVILESPPIPNDATAAGPHVADELCRKIQRAMVALTPQSPALQATRKGGVMIGGFLVRDDAFFDVIRKARKLVGAK